MMIRFAAALMALALALPAAARADDCTAIPDDGTIPAYLSLGRPFAGPVVAVIDGDSLCVAVGERKGDDWVEVRLADFYAPEISSPTGPAARAALQSIAMGKQASCVAGLGIYDRVAARCQIDGQAIGDLMRTAGIAEGGDGTSDRRPRVIRPQISVPLPEPAGLSCPELRARGGARRGEPGYRADQDSDGDGISCEPLRRGATRRTAR
jgi:hypothetical protein